MAAGAALAWVPENDWLHMWTAATAAGACLSVAFTLLFIIRRNSDREVHSVAALFVVLMFGCAAFLLLEGWNAWRPGYMPAAAPLVLLACGSMITAALLSYKLPQILTWPTRIQLFRSKHEFHREVALRRKMSMSLQESDAQLREAFDHAPIGKALVDLDGRLTKVNRALCDIVGYSAEELVSRDIRSITYGGDLTAGLAEMHRLLAGDISTYQIEKRYCHREGRPVWVLLSVTLVRSDAGEPRYFIAQIVNIDERKRTEKDLREIKEELEARVEARTRELATVNRQLKESVKRLRTMARTDALTGLNNRWELMGRLERQLHESQRYATEWCLMLIDIDHFKQLNDCHGHVMGDRALEAFGKAIRGHTRDTDFAARYGGDEFCVLVPHADRYHTGQLAGKLLETLQAMDLRDGAGERIEITCSIGIIQWEPGLNTIEKLIDAADARLYKAKKAGRARVEGVVDDAV